MQENNDLATLNATELLDDAALEQVAGGPRIANDVVAPMNDAELKAVAGGPRIAMTSLRR
jgi:hypothetical protein